MARRRHSTSSSSSSSDNSTSSDSSSDSSPDRKKGKSKTVDNSKQSSKTSGRPVKRISENEKRNRDISPSQKKNNDRAKPRKSTENDKPASEKKNVKSDAKDSKRRREDRKQTGSKEDKSTEKETKVKNLFPIMGKEASSTQDHKRKITETQLVSYPNLNINVTDVNRSKRSRGDYLKNNKFSPEQFKSLSSTITVKQQSGIGNRDKLPSSENTRGGKAPEERSLREQVGWDPFRANTTPQYGDHDDRQVSRGYNDSYTRKESRRFRGRGGLAGWRDGPRIMSRDGPHIMSRDGPRDWSQGGTRGGMWSNNRSFNRGNDDNKDRSGINDNKWKRDLFSDE